MTKRGDRRKRCTSPRAYRIWKLGRKEKALQNKEQAVQAMCEEAMEAAEKDDVEHQKDIVCRCMECVVPLLYLSLLMYRPVCSSKLCKRVCVSVLSFVALQIQCAVLYRKLDAALYSLSHDGVRGILQFRLLLCVSLYYIILYDMS